VLEEVSDLQGIEVSRLDQNDIILNGTASFNDRNTLYALLEQTAHYEEIPVFPADFEALKTITQSYGTGNVVFTLVEHHYDANISWATVGYSVLLFPTLPITILGYVPIQLIRGHHTEITVLVLDAKSGELRASTQEEFRNRPLKHYLGAHYYDIFGQLKTTSSK
jgi:hypothetical protein